MSSRADRIVEIRPDANLPPWSLFVDDDEGAPISYGDEDTFVVKVRTASTVVTVAGSMTASSVATQIDADEPVPTFRFTPTAASLALVPAEKRAATILVYVGSGDVVRHDFPAKVIP